jgi:AcrR family transcriptional regulator
MISCHFDGKADLIAEVVRDVLATSLAYMRERIDAVQGPAAELRAYIESNLAFIAEHPVELTALLDCLRHGGGGAATAGTGDWLHGAVDVLEACLREGQRTGEFGRFDPRVMVITVLGLASLVYLVVAAEFPDWMRAGRAGAGAARTVPAAVHEERSRVLLEAGSRARKSVILVHIVFPGLFGKTGKITADSKCAGTHGKRRLSDGKPACRGHLNARARPRWLRPCVEKHLGAGFTTLVVPCG